MRSTRTLTVFMLLLAGLFVSSIAQAQTIYTDRTLFETDNPGLVTEDFESGAVADGGVIGCIAPLDSTGDGVCFQPGDLLPGASYTTDGPEQNSIALLGAGGFGNPSKAIVADFFVNTFAMDFSEPNNTAVGMDLICPFGAELVTVNVYGNSGLILTDTPNCTPAGVFFGASSNDVITRVEIISPSGAPEGVDNVSFGAGAIVEPSSVARFVVTKDFSDDNPQDVMVHISCNTGLPLEQSFMISDSQSDPDGSLAPPQPGVTFVVTSYGDGAMDCSITETPVDGYTPLYQASGSSTSVDDDPDLPGCHFSEINFGAINSCNIGNTLDPVTFTVNKVWEFADDQADFEEVVFVEFTCQNFRLDPFSPITDEAFFSLIMSPQNPSVDAPPIFPNFGTPATQCRALETGLVSGVESDQGCAEWQTLNVGGPDVSCTITNTAFFEGIPTLSQYGLALLALLMMGVGMVGIRRMV